MNLEGKAMAVVGGIIGLVLVIVLVAALYPTLVEAGTDLQVSGQIVNATGHVTDQGTFERFNSGGVLWTIFGIIIFVGAIIAVIAFIKTK